MKGHYKGIKSITCQSACHPARAWPLSLALTFLRTQRFLAQPCVVLPPHLVQHHHTMAPGHDDKLHNKVNPPPAPHSGDLPSQHDVAQSYKKYNFMYYVKGALAGGICCSITHAALCPVDVVKTRIQLDPIKYTQGILIHSSSLWSCKRAIIHHHITSYNHTIIHSCHHQAGRPLPPYYYMCHHTTHILSLLHTLRTAPRLSSLVVTKFFPSLFSSYSPCFCFILLFSLSFLLLFLFFAGLVGTARQIVAEEGAGALSSGLGATAAGYI